ncbi:MAG: OmpA family protein [Bacteroidota bacterium]
MRIVIGLFLLFSISSQAQVMLSTKSKKAIELYTEADNFRVRGQFSQAIALLNQALDKDKEFVEAYYRLGIVYMSVKEFPTAIQHFEKGLTYTNDPRKQKVFWFDLGESYFTVGDYDKAEKVITDFLKVELQNKQKIDRATLLLKNVEFAKENKEIASRYKLKVLSDTINAFVMQYFPVLTADQQEMIFTRRLGNGPNEDEDLVLSRKTAGGRWNEPQSISKNINTRLNEGTCTISADGRKLIFTSCVGREGHGSCDLYESRKIGNDWTEPKNLGSNVNSADWESQPSLSADGRTLYFVSDRRGGAGRRDIWVTTLSEKGAWTRAKNIGKPINTVYDEISPFIHVNNKILYFASNGLVGFGGYDIFSSERDTSKTWSNPVNIGAPINNHEDQFSLFITADGKKGYYSHEEYKSAGYSTSKIYEMEIPEENQIKFKSNYVKGIVRDKQTREVLSAKIELINLASNVVESLVESDSLSGEYLMVLTQGAEYALYVNKKGYLFQSLNFNYSEIKNYEPIVLNIDLEKAREGSTAVLKNLFFDVDKYDLKEKSITELHKIIRFLEDNPQFRVEISGHTDNSGSLQYNRELSLKRAQSVYNFLKANGVAQTRLLTKGFGPDKPIADNTTEDGRQLNRRIEFKILK